VQTLTRRKNPAFCANEPARRLLTPAHFGGTTWFCGVARSINYPMRASIEAFLCGGLLVYTSNIYLYLSHYFDF
jgi:hypothetical protein